MHSCIISFSHLFITNQNMHKRVHKLCTLTFHLCSLNTCPVQIKICFRHYFSHLHFPTFLFTTVLPLPFLPALSLLFFSTHLSAALTLATICIFHLLPHLLHPHHRQPDGVASPSPSNLSSPSFAPVNATS